MEPLTFSQLLMRWLDGRAPAACCSTLGVNANTLRNWLAGRTYPPATRHPLLSAQLGVTEPELWTAIERQRQPVLPSTEVAS